MNLHTHSYRLRSLCVLILGFLLIATQARARSAGEDESPRNEKEFASISLQIEERGAAKVTVSLARVPDDPAALKKSLSEALGFPLQVNNERGDSDQEDDVARWFLVLRQSEVEG
jgi:hypothetical protein